MRINDHTMVSAVAIRHVWAASLRMAWDYRQAARAAKAGSVRLIYRNIYLQRRLVARALRRLLREAKPAREEAAQ